MSEEKRKPKVKMTVSNSFKIFIARAINSNFKEGDIDKGYTKVVNSGLGGYIYYKRPPKDMMILAIVKKRDLPDDLIRKELKEILPDLIIYV